MYVRWKGLLWSIGMVGEIPAVAAESARQPFLRAAVANRDPAYAWDPDAGRARRAGILATLPHRPLAPRALPSSKASVAYTA